MENFSLIGNILLGVGLAMDAFSVSIANGLNEPHMPRKRMCLMAGCYAWFQWMMPMIGWFCVHTIAESFRVFQRFIPWIALILLLWIGGKMLVEGIRELRSGSRSVKVANQKTDSADNAGPEETFRLSHGALFIQGVATSIDALSVGFTIAKYNAAEAFCASLVIAGVTFCICMTGLLFGRKFGEKLSDKASILGGLILIAIGIEIFVSGVL